jgi:phosphatidylglycerol:prolipoprotein diacylglycerol transferase
MHPLFVRLGPLTIHTYGVLVALGFMLGITVAYRNARRAGIDADRIGDLGVWLVLAGMLGGKLFHIIFFWDDFRAGWRAVGIASLREGFVFFGGFIAAMVVTILYTRRKGLPLMKVADAFAPGAALGHAFGRLGCFFEGCCYGRACDLPWAVQFPSSHLAAGFRVHPSQLYEAAGNLVIFAGLSLYARRKRFDGQVWWSYVLAYGALRFVIEFFRGDYETYYFGVFTNAHLIAAGLMVAALWFLSRQFRMENRAQSR